MTIEHIGVTATRSGLSDAQKRQADKALRGLRKAKAGERCTQLRTGQPLEKSPMHPSREDLLGRYLRDAEAAS